MAIDYNGRVFISSLNDTNGEVDEQTVFHYHQRGIFFWAHYQGGNILIGTMTGKVLPNDHLEFTYQHLNTKTEWRSGSCHSVPEVLPDGRIRLYESWKWTSGELSSGFSTVVEVLP